MLKFYVGQMVQGVKAGLFVVAAIRSVAGETVIDVMEVGPQGQRMAVIGMSPECFKSRVWTEAMVKQELPIVRVQFDDGHIVRATISGRRNQFARVSWEYGGECEASWSTLAYVLSTNDGIMSY